MVVVIEKSHSNVGNTLRYNENKMDGVQGVRTQDDEFKEIAENGHVLATRNVPDGTTIDKEFERLESLANRVKKSGPYIKNVSFHMSVNPGEKDGELSEEKAVELIDDIMKGLGYADSPYRIYKHTDIERKHYHVVSCRIGQDGKKISDSFEQYKLQTLLKQLSQEYGFDFSYEEEKKKEEKAKAEEEDLNAGHPVKTEPGKKTRKDDKDEKKKEIVPAFSRKSDTPVIRQIENAHDDVVQNWSFTTFEQYQALLLRRYNILAELERKGENDERLVYFGTNKKGEPITPQLYESDFNRNDMLSAIRQKAESVKMSSKKDQKKRIEQLSNAAAKASGSMEEFRAIMERKGVYAVLSWTKDGKLFGVTWVDRATKCIWKGSETSVDAHWLQQTAEEKGWKLEKNGYEILTERRRSMPSKQTTTPKKTETKPKNNEKGGRARAIIANILPKSGRPINFGHGQNIDTGHGRKKDDIWEDETEKLDRNMEM